MFAQCDLPLPLRCLPAFSCQAKCVCAADVKVDGLGGTGGNDSVSPGAVRVAAFALKVAFGTELGTQHTLGGGRVVARPGNTCLEQSCACAITWEPSFVCLRCRSKLTVQEVVSKRLQGWRVLKRSDLEQEAQELHVASLHGAGDPQLGLLIICMENVILCHVPTQRVCRVQQLGRSFGVQNRFFFSS